MIQEFEGNESEMGDFLAQVIELLEKLNKKVDNAATRILFLERKVRELKKEVRLLRLGKGKMEEEEEEDDEVRKEKEKEIEEGEKEEENEAEQENNSEKDESSTTESNALSPIFDYRTGHKYALRQRESKKFSNTMDTPLVLTPTPHAPSNHMPLPTEFAFSNFILHKNGILYKDGMSFL